jgi:hypothetical protein
MNYWPADRYPNWIRETAPSDSTIRPRARSRRVGSDPGDVSPVSPGATTPAFDRVFVPVCRSGDRFFIDRNGPSTMLMPGASVG